jgi:hypothetical protein
VTTGGKTRVVRNPGGSGFYGTPAPAPVPAPAYAPQSGTQAPVYAPQSGPQAPVYSPGGRQQ